MDYTVRQAQRDFERGLIRGATLVSPLGSEVGYWILLNDGSPYGGPLVDSRSGSIRYFRTLDAAASALHKIGFSPAVSFVVGSET